MTSGINISLFTIAEACAYFRKSFLLEIVSTRLNVIKTDYIVVVITQVALVVNHYYTVTFTV